MRVHHTQHIRHMRRGTRQGFTLVELLVSVAIMGFMVTLMVLLISIGMTTYQDANTRIYTQEESRRLLGTLVRELRESSPTRVDIATAGQISFTVPIRAIGGINDGHTEDTVGNPLFGARLIPSRDPAGYEALQIRYLLVPGAWGNALVRRVVDATGNQMAGTTDMVIANNVANMQYSLSGRTLSIGFTVQDMSDRNRQKTMTGTVGVAVRN